MENKDRKIKRVSHHVHYDMKQHIGHINVITRVGHLRYNADPIRISIQSIRSDILTIHVWHFAMQYDTIHTHITIRCDNSALAN